MKEKNTLFIEGTPLSLNGIDGHFLKLISLIFLGSISLCCLVPDFYCCMLFFGLNFISIKIIYTLRK